jgi:lysozyme
MAIEGIDVSHYQGQPDFARVYDAERSFIYLKCLDGIHGADATFTANRKAAHAGKLLVGAYHFFRPTQDAGAQADAFCAIVGSIQPGELPPMLDIEEAPANGVTDTWPSLVLTDRLAAIARFIQDVETGLGVRPILYTRRGFWNTMLAGSAEFAACQLWLAEYRVPAGDSDAPHLPQGFTSWTFWQYSGTGACDGVQGQCDLDRFNGSLAQLQALAAPSS